MSERGAGGKDMGTGPPCSPGGATHGCQCWEAVRPTGPAAFPCHAATSRSCVRCVKGANVFHASGFWGVFSFFFNSLTCRGCRWLRIFADPGVLLPPTRWHRARESNFHCQEAAYQLYETISLVWEGSYSAFGSQEKKKRSPNRLSKIL